MLTTARNAYILGRVERTIAEVVAAQAELLRRGQFRPAFAGIQFGETGRIPALRVATPTGNDVLVHGAIDRVDLLPGGTHAAVFDYKLTVGPLSLQEVRYGLSLQLLTYLLVLQASGEELAGKPLTPVAAFYMQLLRRMNDVDHPDDALDPADPRFNLRIKPRGVFDGTYLPAFDRDFTEGRSDVVAAFIRKDGTFGRSGSDVVDTRELAALLWLVRKRIGEIADEIVSGKVDVTPYRLGRATPCPRCEYRSVCRFEPSINRYVNLQPMSRDDVLASASQPGETP
jgi:ATP-dependent helicase/nuclease subunit B